MSDQPFETHSKNSHGKQRAVVDIDETICDYNGDRIYENARPRAEQIAKINKLYDQGWIIVYDTSRGHSEPNNKQRMQYIYELTRKQLEQWGCKYHELSVGKPLYDLIIDDKAKRIEELKWTYDKMIKNPT